MTIFERIVSREIPAYIVYEDDLVLAFLDIQQTTKGHTLVIPKKPYKDIFEIPDEVLSHLIKVAKKLSLKISKALDAKGVNLLNNNGRYAGQTVFHYHMHIIPRYLNDDFQITFSDNSNKLTSADYTSILNELNINI